MRGNFFYKRLGKNISTARKKKGVTQEWLSQEAYVDRIYLANIEAGRANPTTKILYKIANKLQITLSELLKGV